MRIKNSVSSAFDIKVEEGEELYLRFGDEDAIKVVAREKKINIKLYLLNDPFLKNGGPDVVRDAGKINSYAQIEFDLERKK